jgi:hypothetical protein
MGIENQKNPSLASDPNPEMQIYTQLPLLLPDSSPPFLSPSSLDLSLSLPLPPDADEATAWRHMAGAARHGSPAAPLSPLWQPLAALDGGRG